MIMIMGNQKFEQNKPKIMNGKKQKQEAIHVFLIGSKGIPASYGGFETFVEKLTKYRKCEHIAYHVARISDNNDIDDYNRAEIFNVKVPDLGSCKAVLYDILSLRRCLAICRAQEIKNPVVYIMACRIGPFLAHYKKKIRKIGGTVILNPDGNEWKRAKWNWLIRQYWKCSERLMVKNADYVVCDSKVIQKYICKKYESYRPQTSYISYGCELVSGSNNQLDENYQEWLNTYHFKPYEYYLIVCRFVPENNFEVILREFMQSDTEKKLVVVTDIQKKFWKKLEKKLHFTSDPRIVFVGTVYDDILLKEIRRNAYAYLHGHEVGGTNPSLLEAMGSTAVNLLLNVSFNREVAEKAGIYWEKEEGNLADIIHQTDHMTEEERKMWGIRSKERIRNFYSWDRIVEDYEGLFEKVGSGEKIDEKEYFVSSFEF